MTPVTGGFFTKTKAAVETAQKTSGLKVTGVVTPELWAALGISTSAKLADLPTSPVVEPANEEPLPTTDPGVIPQPETPPVVAPTIKTPNPIADTVAFDAAGEYQSQVICDPSPKIGADRLRALLKEVYGETVIGIYTAQMVGPVNTKKAEHLIGCITGEILNNEPKLNHFFLG